MADDQNYPANTDVIQGARAIRSNPALFARVPMAGAEDSFGTTSA